MFVQQCSNCSCVLQIASQLPVLVEHFINQQDLDFLPNPLNKKKKKMECSQKNLEDLYPYTGNKEYFLLHNFHLVNKG